MKRRDGLLAAAALLSGCGGGSETHARDCARPAVYEGVRSDGPTALPVADTATQAMEAARAACFDELLQELIASTGMPAVSAALACDLGRWQASAGLACTRPESPVNTQTVFYWGSVAKAATAVLVLQLVEAGRLRMGDTLSRWFPQFAEASRITIAQLLTHTSGLATNTGLPPLGATYEPPELLIAAAAKVSSPYCPGAGFNYSNVGYLLLGLIAEREGGDAYHRLVQQRIPGPLGLQTLRAARPAEVLDDMAVPHLGRDPRPDPGVSSRLGMGNIVARAEDMLGFWRALMTGRLLSAQTMRQQWATLSGVAGAPSLAFGQGVMQIEWTDWAGRPRTWWGHLGGTEHANALVAFDPFERAFLAVAVNSQVSSAAVAHRLLKMVALTRDAAAARASG